MTAKQDLLPTIAVIPVKHLENAKSRLSARLSSDERADLVLRLLDHVLAVVSGWPGIQHRVVVSPDPLVRAHAAALGAIAIDDGDEGVGQNAALEHARGVARRWNPGALLVTSGDLPLLSLADLEEIDRLGKAEGSVVLAPDRHGVGTNALYLRPPDLLPFRFGGDSFRRHARDAEARGLRTFVYRGPGTAWDLDVPEDVELIQSVDATFQITQLRA